MSALSPLALSSLGWGSRAGGSGGDARPQPSALFSVLRASAAEGPSLFVDFGRLSKPRRRGAAGCGGQKFGILLVPVASNKANDTNVDCGLRLALRVRCPWLSRLTIGQFWPTEPSSRMLNRAVVALFPGERADHCFSRGSVRERRIDAAALSVL